MQRKHKGFSLIELLVVILLIGITSAIAIPNINDWITDRKVKKETISFVKYLEGKKSQIQQGGYPVLVVGVRATPNLYYMTRDEFNIQMVAATYIAIAMRLYKTSLTPEEYESMVETIMETEVEPYVKDKETMH